MRTVGKLRHGGIIATYRCTAACRHCLYASSPKRSGDYIDAEMATALCGVLREGGCDSVHIGGGEPFLQFEGLLRLIKTAVASGVSIDYVETNAYWAVDEKAIAQRLHALWDAGADALCISIDPFHAEYVPVERPLLLAKVCKKEGFSHFLWQERFRAMLPLQQSKRPQPRSALEAHLGKHYVRDTAERYGITYGGRAINIEAEYRQRKPVALLLHQKPCNALVSTDHFHADLYGQFIPPGCTGLAIPLVEVVRGMPKRRYAVLEALLSGGTEALYAHACAEGFVAQEGYPSACALCFDMRHYLSGRSGHPELYREHYLASLAYYDA